jgi:hypothetical protein
MVDFVPALLLIALGAGALALLDRVTGSTFRAFSASFAAYRPESWPIGVQEEDAGRRWGRNAAAGPDEDDLDATDIVPVHGIVTRRKRVD